MAAKRKAKTASSVKGVKRPSKKTVAAPRKGQFWAQAGSVPSRDNVERFESSAQAKAWARKQVEAFEKTMARISPVEGVEACKAAKKAIDDVIIDAQRCVVRHLIDPHTDYHVHFEFWRSAS